jgi:hypothetical protein
MSSKIYFILKSYKDTETFDDDRAVIIQGLLEGYSRFPADCRASGAARIWCKYKYDQSACKDHGRPF